MLWLYMFSCSIWLQNDHIYIARIVVGVRLKLTDDATIIILSISIRVKGVARVTFLNLYALPLHTQLDYVQNQWPKNNTMIDHIYPSSSSSTLSFKTLEKTFSNFYGSSLFLLNIDNLQIRFILRWKTYTQWLLVIEVSDCGVFSAYRETLPIQLIGLHDLR